MCDHYGRQTKHRIRLCEQNAIYCLLFQRTEREFGGIIDAESVM